MATVRNSSAQRGKNGTGRGNERVTADDVRSVAHQEVKDKWAHVPRAIEYLRTYIEHLNTLAADKHKHTVTSGIQLLDDVFKLKERISEHVKTPVEGVYDRIRFTLVPELMLDAEMTTTTIDGIGRCTVQDDISVTVPKDNKDEFMAWLIDHEQEDLVSRTVNAQTLAAFVRAQLKKGKDGIKLPVKLIKVTPITRAVITRS